MVTMISGSKRFLSWLTLLGVFSLRAGTSPAASDVPHYPALGLVGSVSYIGNTLYSVFGLVSGVTVEEVSAIDPTFKTVDFVLDSLLGSSVSVTLRGSAANNSSIGDPHTLIGYHIGLTTLKCMKAGVLASTLSTTVLIEPACAGSAELLDRNRQ